MTDQKNPFNDWERVLEALPGALVVFCLEGDQPIVVWANRAFGDLIGGNSGELAGSGLIPLLSGPTFTEGDVAVELPAAISSKVPSTIKIGVTPDGTPFHMEIKQVGEESSDPFYLGILTPQSTEPSSREKATDLALECSGVGVFDWNIAEGTCIVSDEWYRQLGHPIGKSILKSEETHQFLNPIAQEIVFQGIHPALVGETDEFEVEFPVEDSEGNTGWIRSKGKVIAREANGEATRIVGMNTNITQMRKVNEELKKSERLFGQLEKMVLAGGWEYFNDTNESRWTEMIFRIFEMEPNSPALNADSAVGFFDQPYRDRLLDSFYDLLNYGTPYDLEGRIVTAKGNVRWVRTIGESEAGGEPCSHIWGVMIDITERKLAQERESLANSRFRAATNAAQIALWQYDPANDEVIWDDQMYKLLGVDSGASITWNFWMSLIDERDRPRLLAAVEDMIGLKQTSTSLVFRIITPDGEVKFLQGHFSPEKGEDGRLARLIGLNWDVTGEESTRRALALSEERFRLILDNSPSAVAMCNREMEYIAYSRRWLEDYKLGDRNIIGLSHYEVFPEIPQRWKDLHRKCIDEGVVLRCEEDEFERLSGDVDYIRWELQPWRDLQGNIGGLIMFTEILTEKRKAQDALKTALQAKAEFIATVSHEIRTPMNGILGMIALLLDSPLNDEQLDFAMSIENSAESLLTLINDILDFSKIEAGKMRMLHAPFDPVILFEQVVELLETRASPKGLDLVMRLYAGLPEKLEGDAGRIRQIIMNLLGNAIKFTQEGNVLLEARTNNITGNQCELDVRVTDTGPGIPDDKVESVFEDFSQIHLPHHGTEGGTGLGLAICQRLVRLMGGQIGYERAATGGACFWFRIPIGIPVEEDSPNPFAGNRALPDHILVIDTEPHYREAISELLRGEGCQDVRTSPSLSILEDWTPLDAGEHIVIVGLGVHPPAHLLDELETQLQAIGSWSRLLILAPRTSSTHGIIRRKFPQAYILHRPFKRASLLRFLRDPERRETGGRSLVNRIPGPENRGVPTGSRILVVEDNAVNKKLLEKFLERLECRIEFASDGKDAVRMATEREYHAILMDCKMPVMDGFEATRMIRDYEGGSSRHTPIIALTANALAEDRQACFEAGMDDFLSKPIRPNVLADTLGKWISSEE